jgi:hypothetical protein
VERRAGGVYPDIRPRRPRFGLTEKKILVEIPRVIRDLKGRPGAIAAWQRAVRPVFIRSFKAGWRVDDFIFGERCFYVLDKKTRWPRRSFPENGTEREARISKPFTLLNSTLARLFPLVRKREKIEIPGGRHPDNNTNPSHSGG